MSNVKIEGNASGTGTLTIAAPNTNTDRTLTLPDGAGEILTDATNICFSAYQSSELVVSATTNTKVPFDVEELDSHGFFDTTNYRFQPTTSGWYFIGGTVRPQASTSMSGMRFELFKNGSVKHRVAEGGPDFNASSLTYSTIVYLNGTDYLELYGWISGSGTLAFNTSASDGKYGARMFGYLLRAA